MRGSTLAYSIIKEQKRKEYIKRKAERIKRGAIKIMNNRAELLDVTKEQQERIDIIREAFSNMYDLIDDKCKSSRETSLVYTKLEEAQFWAIKGITRESD